MILLILFLFNQTNITDKIMTVQKEIQILNLVNGLELSDKQLKIILEKAREKKEIKDNFSKEIRDKEENALQILNSLKENRMTNYEIPDDLRKKVHFAEEEFRDYRLKMSEALGKITNEVENILNGNQIYLLEQYIPCLIPPPGESRIGQSENPAGIIKQLTKIREMPDWLYETKKSVIVDKTLEKIKRHLPKKTEFDEDAERRRILELFDEIRNMNDIDFALKKENYVERLKGKYLVKEIPLNLSFKIERFLLDPLVIPILEQKVKTSK